MDALITAPGSAGSDSLALAVLHAVGVPLSGLLHQTDLGAGVSVSLDVAAPGCWRTFFLREWSVDAEAVVRALIGRAATAQLHAWTKSRPAPGSPASRSPQTIQVDLANAGPWLRIAAADALDAKLHAPLDQALLDAERAAARGVAARTLDDSFGKLPTGLVGEALVLARGAASGLSTYLDLLAATSRQIPDGLYTALAQVVEGYDWLRRQVDGPEPGVEEVARRWQGLLLAHPEVSAGAAGSLTPARATVPDDPPGRLSSLIDPRQLPARLLALSADPRRGEVTLSRTRVQGGEAVLVRVPAYAGRLDVSKADHLQARLVEQQSGELRSYSMLTLDRTSSPIHFQGTLPLGERRLDDVRVDIFDVDSTLPPAVSDSDGGLQQARRAVVFVHEWRRLAAAVLLPQESVRPALRLQQIAQLLQNAESDRDTPLFEGGPSVSDLLRWSSRGDARLARDLVGALAEADPEAGGQADDGDLINGLTLPRGPGRLLTAELAAVFALS